MQEKDNDNKKIILEFPSISDEEAIYSFIENYKDPKNESWNYRNEENGSSCLHILIHKDLFDLVYQVIDITKKNLNKEEFKKFINVTDHNGLNALHLSCFKGDMKLIKYLISQGIDYTCTTKTGLSCLHYSAQTNKVTPIYYFIKEKKININIKDNNGNTFFHWACYCASDKVIDFFIYDKNININEENAQGFIPLHYYIMSKSTRSLKKLMVRGADPYKKNEKGMNAFDIVKKIKYNNTDINKEEINKILKGRFCNNIDKNNKDKKIFNRQMIPFVFFFIIHFGSPFIAIFESSSYFEEYIKTINSYVIFIILFWIYIYIFLKKEPEIIQKNKNNNYLINIIKNDHENSIDLWQYCIKCQNKKEFNIKHCFFCDKCINEFDHHCIWLNKCIGKGNKKIFILLLVLIFFNTLFNSYIFYLNIRNDNSKVKYITKIIIFIIYLFFAINILVIVLPLIKFYYCEKDSGPKNNSNIIIEEEEEENLLSKS